MLERESILELLKEIIDPEIGINIVDLGLVNSIEITSSCIEIHFMTTAHACPMAGLIEREIHRIVSAKAGGSMVVKVIQDTGVKWDRSRMSEEARKILG